MKLNEGMAEKLKRGKMNLKVGIYPLEKT